MTAEKCYLNTVAVISAAGGSLQEMKQSMFENKQRLVSSAQYGSKQAIPLGICQETLPEIPLDGAQWQSRNNQLAVALLQQMEGEITDAIEQYGASRIAVVIGTSTSSISEVEHALAHYREHAELPVNHHYSLQEMGNTAQFVAELLGIQGPAYAISTACSSGAKALASGRRLVRSGVCDVAIVGGIDTLCQLTVQGFSSLEAVSTECCNPFSRNRKGINIGEGGALFVLSKEAKGVELAGVGESSDAHHISAPDPSGQGAVRSMEAALKDAEIDAASIDYINLHGTATMLNDQMEARAVHQVFGSDTPCSSTKPFTGHTLGAAGAIEAAICWASVMDSDFLPLHKWDGVYDQSLPELNLLKDGVEPRHKVKYALSNSFAFGGNNISIILGARK